MFSPEYIQAYRALPRPIHRWHRVLAFGFVLILLLGSEALRMTGGREPVPAQPYMSLVNGDLEVIFAGSSHIGYGIDPRLYRMSGMNITAGALSYEGIEIILNKYLDRAPHLKVLVVEAGIVPLRVDTMARLDGDYRSLYRLGLTTFDLPLGLYPKTMQWVRESRLLYPIYFEDRWSPSLLIWGTRPLGSEGEGRLDTRGHTSLERVISGINDGAVVVEHHRSDHLRLDHSAYNLPALLRIMDVAQQRNLPVVFIRTPHHASYVELRPPEWEAQFQHMVEAVRKRMRPDLLHVLDWERHPAFQPEHFADADHLNVRGVAVLRDLLDPILTTVGDRP